METYEFDTTYSAITGAHIDDIYIPTVDHDDMHDILIDGIPHRQGDDWHAITGKTNQHGYNGAVMHPSETASDDTIREWVREAGGDIFALVPVVVPCGYCASGEPMEHNCEESELAGWAIIYRKAE